MSKKNKNKNYLDFIPVRNPKIEFETSEKGQVTLFIERILSQDRSAYFPSPASKRHQAGYLWKLCMAVH